MHDPFLKCKRAWLIDMPCGIVFFFSHVAHSCKWVGESTLLQIACLCSILFFLLSFTHTPTPTPTLLYTHSFPLCLLLRLISPFPSSSSSRLHCTEYSSLHPSGSFHGQYIINHCFHRTCPIELFCPFPHRHKNVDLQAQPSSARFQTINRWFLAIGL